MVQIRKRLMLSLIAMAVSLPLLMSPASAQNRPCLEDFQKFCPDVERGNRRLMIECLSEHADELSPACKERTQRMQARLSRMRDACKQDLQTFCADVQPGGGSIRQCLEQHKTELSPDCQAALAQRRPMRRQGPQ